MRLDFFVPFRPRRKKRRFAPTWRSSPVRRAVQALFFLAFLWLFFVVAWPYGSADYAAHREGREIVDAELILALDPLVSLTTALAARAWVWSLGFAAVMLAVCVVIPRGFCSYVCPLGTLIDLFDWALGRRVTRFRVARDGWWVHLKYYLLVGTLAAAAFGVLLSGLVAAIPVVTRGLLFVFGPVQSGVARDWYLVPPLNAGHFVSIALFLAVLALGFLRPRFWCRYVCPTGAVFSAFNVARVTERKVESSCIHCDKCVEICPFDAIKADFTTRTADCTLCQTCGGVCPTRAIKFVDRWNGIRLKAENDPPTREIPMTRRGFLAGTAAGVAAAFGVAGTQAEAFPIRPPGSVPEADFRRLCIRCGECFQACPNDVLHPMGFAHGLDTLWTPEAVPNWAGCEPTCNNCGQVCPTGAIRALPIEEKAAARMGLAVVDGKTCLPYAAREACRMCVDECNAAGYEAIEFIRLHPELDEEGYPIDGSGYLSPVVVADRCVGCGLCQTRCHGINVEQKGLLARTAIEVLAGPGREDRINSGSYLELREDATRGEGEADGGGDDEYLPDFLDDSGK